MAPLYIDFLYHWILYDRSLEKKKLLGKKKKKKIKKTCMPKTSSPMLSRAGFSLLSFCHPLQLLLLLLLLILLLLWQMHGGKEKKGSCSTNQRPASAGCRSFLYSTPNNGSRPSSLSTLAMVPLIGWHGPTIKALPLAAAFSQLSITIWGSLVSPPWSRQRKTKNHGSQTTRVCAFGMLFFWFRYHLSPPIDGLLRRHVYCLYCFLCLYSTVPAMHASHFLAQFADQETLNLLSRLYIGALLCPSWQDQQAVSFQHCHHPTAHLILVRGLRHDVSFCRNRHNRPLVLWPLIQTNVVCDLW